MSADGRRVGRGEKSNDDRSGTDNAYRCFMFYLPGATTGTVPEAFLCKCMSHSSDIISVCVNQARPLGYGRAEDIDMATTISMKGKRGRERKKWMGGMR